MKPNLKCFGAALVLLLGWIFVSESSAFGKDPIKIGFIAPYTGMMAKGGEDMDRGFRLYLDEISYKVAGRQIVMITADSETKPELGPTRARKLIEDDKVPIIAGVGHSGVALAIRDIVHNSKTPLIITCAGERSLTGKLKSPYIFRTSFANGQQDFVGGWYAYKLGYRRMIVIALDFSAGHDKADAFMKTFKAAGGEIVDQIYVPLTTTDFSPYLTKILAEAKSADGVWAFITSGASIPFVNQYAEYGVKNVLPMFPIGDTVDDLFLPSMKQDSPAGIKSYLTYAATLNTPENKKFVQEYVAKYKENPSYFAEMSYVGAKAIVMALQAINGDIENKKEQFLAALRKVEFMSPHGPFRFDANQNINLPIYLREVRKIDGKYVNVILETITESVDQDGNWKPFAKK